MTDDEQMHLYEKREHKVVKHNDIVQKSKYKLSVVEQKTVAFLVSLIKPKSNISVVQPLEYDFEIKEYCRVCGINSNSGTNYQMVRDTLKSLSDKSVIITLSDGITETNVRWVNKFWSNKKSGKAKIRFDEDIIPYLFELCENTTRYELLNILPMQSKYAIRLYEICRSWAGITSKKYSLKELRELLMIADDELVRYPDFRRKVLEKAQEEINLYTDLNVYFEPITQGRKTIDIRVHIKKKEREDRYESQRIANKALGEIK